MKFERIERHLPWLRKRDTKMAAERKSVEAARKRYDRIAPLYDGIEGLIELSR